MNAKEFSSLLCELGACEEAQTWAKDKSLTDVWEQCNRGDWLLWLCGRMADKEGWPTRKQVVLAACSCAETALQYVPAGDDRPRIAIETARKWANGEATIEEVRNAAAHAAHAAHAAAHAAHAAANAAHAAHAAANAAANAAYAAYAAANAANAAFAHAAYAYAFANAAYAAYAAANAAYAFAHAAHAAANAANAFANAAYAARSKSLSKCADIVRSMLTRSVSEARKQAV